MMRIYLLVISGVLAISSLIGVFATNMIPARVMQEQTLVKYSHQGTFDYAIHMQPSPLNGMSSTSSYPLAAVNNFNITFSYEQTEEEPQTVRIEAVLENPGIWQKTLSLVPETAYTGDFEVPFALNVADIVGRFDVIEQELNLTDAKRDLIIKAYVKNSHGTCIQTLPVSISKNLIEVSNDLVYNRLWFAGSFQYTVNLNPNSAFDTPTIQSPIFDSDLSTLRPGSLIIAKLAEEMEVELAYKFTADKEVEDLLTEVELTAAIDSSKLWSRTFPLMENTYPGNFDIYFPLDLSSYLEILDAIGSEIGVSAEASTLAVTAQIHTTGQTRFGAIDDTFSPTLKGTLKGNVITWDKEISKTQPGTIKKTVSLPNNNRYLGLSVSGIRNLMRILFVLCLLFFVAMLFWKPRFQRRAAPAVDRDYQRIKKKYGARIVESRGASFNEGEKPIFMESIEDLIKVSDELGKPVIHHPIGSSGKVQFYYVIDGTTSYQYFVDSAGQKSAANNEEKPVEPPPDAEA